MWRKRGLVAANVLCAAYIVYLVFHPVSKESGGWPSAHEHTNAPATSNEVVVETDAPSPTASTGERPQTQAPRKPASNIPFVTHARTPLTPQQWDAYVALLSPDKNPGGLFSTQFPDDEALTVTSDEMVWKRKSRVYDFLRCFGEDNQSPSVPRYDVAFLPIGCFGDAPGNACLSTSCYFARSLANATFCGQKKFGAFLGDNFYPNGLKKDTDPRFDRDLNTKFFRHGPLRMRYYAMVGNHDKRPHTQIRGPGQHSYWYMPAFNYSGDVIRVQGTTVQVFIVDTHWGFDLSYPHMQAQAQWLDEQLGASTATWKVVMSHEPVFCFADFDHNRALLDFIHPVLLKHKVQLFVAAHVHGVFLHKVQGGYYQLTSAGFADNVHTHVKAKRPRGYYHLGRGATAVFFSATHADVVGFMPDASTIFTHRIPVVIDPVVPVTNVAVGDDKLFQYRHTCEALKPEVPKFCSDATAASTPQG